MREKIEKVETSLWALTKRLESMAGGCQEMPIKELFRLAGEALKALEELKEHERLISEIF